jgi:hypothetical protein
MVQSATSAASLVNVNYIYIDNTRVMRVKNIRMAATARECVVSSLLGSGSKFVSPSASEAA